MISLQRLGLLMVPAAMVFGAGSVGTGDWSCAASLLAEQPAERVFDLAIENGKVVRSMRTARVTQGDKVRLRWTTDRATALHLHGYDIEKKIVPGRVTEFSFTARATGRFAVETHSDGSSHHHGLPLIVLEVYPR
jgi:heme/copper-type cytochrome/quinol oxidase subunit 2